MTRAQFIFSLGSGSALLVAGAALAVSGVGDWGLFWVGGLISGVALSGFSKQARVPAPLPIRLAGKLEG